ncbi:MAG TPA: SAM-dependent methyltransferase [Methylibium sp.]|nr:SAM-dependent methyltransferase [Methylibium sp.]
MAATALPDTAERERFFARLGDSLRERSCVRLVLGKPRQAGAAERVTVRPLALKGVDHLSFVRREATRDLTENLPVADGMARLESMVGTYFAHAHLLTLTEDLQLSVTKRGRWLLHRRAAEREAAEAGHDRPKQRVLDLDTPFLQALGVTDAPGRLVPAMARKWKQINKFVEIVDHALHDSGLVARGGPVGVLDFGAGKGYLTFAVHHHLSRTLGLPAEVTGVELRADLVALCNEAAARLGLAGLRFEEGDVSRLAARPVDVMIALHACDTATDFALHAGVRAGAAVIVSSPCCHKQLRPQMCCPPALKGLLQHGIHLGQQAEMVTDSLRALLLEAEGYETKVFEFVSLEHTSKNKMILATRLALDAVPLARRRAERLAQVAELKAFYGIREQCLEALLAGAESD